jgi:hypothetical protein
MILEKIVLDSANATDACLKSMCREGVVDLDRTEEYYQFLEVCTRHAMRYNYFCIADLQKMCVDYTNRKRCNYGCGE